MKQIKLQSIRLQNFKGVRDLYLQFNHHENFIYGKNGSGKTTIYDAWLWLLFGKDSTGRSDFEIKTLDDQGKTIKDLEHSVIASILYEDAPVLLRKVYREKWVRRRGALEEEFSGNETTYFWNDVPLKKEEYTQRISSMIDENQFRLISDLKYFNNLPWQERRKLLFSCIDQSSIQCPDNELRELLKKKNEEDIKKELSASIKKLKTEIEQIPPRIDELSMRFQKENKPIDLNPEDIEKRLNELTDAINRKEQYTSATTTKILLLKKNLNDIDLKIKDEENRILLESKKEENELLQKIAELRIIYTKQKSKLDTVNSQLEELRRQIFAKKSSIDNLRKEFDERSKQQFTGNLNCPTCNTSYNTEKRNDLISKFNKDKSELLESLNKKGVSLLDEIFNLDKEIDLTTQTLKQEELLLESITKEGAKLNEQLESIKSNNTFVPKQNDTIKELITKKEETKKQIDNLSSVDINDEENEVKEREELLKKRDVIIADEIQRTENLKIKERINELEKDRMNFLKSLSDAERVLHELSKFIKLRIDSIELDLQKKFNGIQFKMFEEQINGGISETCIVMKAGVPYTDLNTASKIEVSLKIIKTFSDINNASVPIFVDNRESVTDLPELNNQIISLIVSPSHEKITIE